MNKRKFVLALLIAAASTALSVLMIDAPQQFGAFGPAAALLLPGVIVAMIASGNVHDFRAWVIAVGNFTFYFGIVYLIWGIRERFKLRAAKSDH